MMHSLGRVGRGGTASVGRLVVVGELDRPGLYTIIKCNFLCL